MVLLRELSRCIRVIAYVQTFWSNTYSEKEEGVTCTVPEIEHGHHCPPGKGATVKVGESATFACDDDFLPHKPPKHSYGGGRPKRPPEFRYYIGGNAQAAVLTCQGNGKFDKPPPKCEPLSCVVPGWIQYYFGTENSTGTVSCQNWPPNHTRYSDNFPDGNLTNAGNMCRAPYNVSTNIRCFVKDRGNYIHPKICSAENCATCNVDRLKRKGRLDAVYPKLPNSDRVKIGPNRVEYRCHSGYVGNKLCIAPASKRATCFTGGKVRALIRTCVKTGNWGPLILTGIMVVVNLVLWILILVFRKRLRRKLSSLLGAIKSIVGGSAPAKGLGGASGSSKRDWVQKQATDGRIYFLNTKTNEKSWYTPDALLSPDKIRETWKELPTADGRVYYYNPKTKETKWALPPKSSGKDDKTAAAEADKAAAGTSPKRVWVENEAPDGRMYYVDKNTGEKSWYTPDELLTPGKLKPPWKECRLADGRVYHYNTETKETKWEKKMGEAQRKDPDDKNAEKPEKENNKTKKEGKKAAKETKKQEKDAKNKEKESTQDKERKNKMKLNPIPSSAASEKSVKKRQK